MNNSERPEFEKHLALLCAGLDVPCTDERKEAYWIALRMMPLGVFARTVEQMLSKESWARVPKPGQIWESSKRLRAEAPAKPKDDGFRGDAWDAAANRYLISFLAKRIAAGQVLPGKPASYEALRASDADLRALGLDRHNLDASGEYVDAIGKLIKAKEEWAADMRDVAVKGEVPVATQKQWWREYMGRALEGR